MFHTSLLLITKTNVIALVLLFTSDPIETQQQALASKLNSTTITGRQNKRR